MDKYVHEHLVNWVGVKPKDCYYESLSPNVGAIYKYTWQNISKFNSMYCYIMVFKKQVDWDMNIKLVAKTTGPLGKTVQSCGFWKEFKSIRVWKISKSPIHKSTLSSQTWMSVDTTVEKP